MKREELQGCFQLARGGRGAWVGVKLLELFAC